MSTTWLEKKHAEFLAKTPGKNLPTCERESWLVALNFYLRLCDGALKLSTSGHLSSAPIEDTKTKIIEQLEKQWIT